MQKPKDKFEVIVRIKPLCEEDKARYAPEQLENCLKWTDNAIALSKKQYDDKYFQFNRVFNNQCQEEVFESIEHLVPELFEGYNSTFLAYGQTGTGKTHTVFGSNNAIVESNAKHTDAGMFYRIGSKLFSEIKRKLDQAQSVQFSVRVNFVEFYLDSVKDLLNYDDKTGYAKLQMKQSTKEGVILKGLTQIPVKSVQELFRVVRQAAKSRKTSATNINKTSSRSHALIQITLWQRWNVNTHNGAQLKMRKGVLKIVDLAGSQRVSKTQSSGDRLQQAKRINKQITTLGKCINMLAISQKSSHSRNNLLSQKFNLSKTHIPYRDCKLTRFLSESLQGKSKIVLCVCVSSFSVHLQQTNSSLLFATQAITLKIDPKKNEQSFRATSSIGNNSSLKLDTSFQTPYKQRQLSSLSPINKPSARSVVTQADKKQIQTLKNDIELIEYQLSGKTSDANFKDVKRQQLQSSLKTYGNIIIDLQNQIQQYVIKLNAYQRKRRY